GCARQVPFSGIPGMLGQSPWLAETPAALGHAAPDAFGGDSAAVLMPRGSDFELAASVRLPDELERALGPRLPASAKGLATAAADERILVSPAVAGDDRFEEPWQTLIGEAGLRSLLAVPAAGRRAGPCRLVLRL